MLPVIVVPSPVNVECGGRVLVGFLTGGAGLGDFCGQSFQASHAHARVLLVLALVYYRYLAATAMSGGLQWLACAVLVVGILAQSGGLFVHMAVGRSGAPSAGALVTTVGAALMAAALLFLADGLIAEYPGCGVRLACIDAGCGDRRRGASARPAAAFPPPVDPRTGAQQPRWRRLRRAR